MAVERYQRIKMLGQGHMSVVWLARDRATQELVALKVMMLTHEDEQRNRKARERFQREIEIVSSLRHPHILPVINHGAILHGKHGVPFFVSPYIPEGSLAAFIKEHPPWEQWTLEQIADAIVQAAESLQYIHTQKPPLVHQDVKPGNFLVHPVGSTGRTVHLYLCDFGIAQRLRSSVVHTEELQGTFAFMAPEQIERNVVCASDQYALACSPVSS